MELGADTLLLDEDTCATNALIRDVKMQALVEKDPITPFVKTVRPLYENQGVSTIMVIGGVGDYLDVADHVLLVDNYHCSDATAKAKEIASKFPSSSSSRSTTALDNSTFQLNNKKQQKRVIVPSKLAPNGKVRVNVRGVISYGETTLDLSLSEQLVSISQTSGIVAAIETLSRQTATTTADEGGLDMARTLELLLNRVDEEGLDAWTPVGQYNGGLTLPRLLEIGAAVNRLRRKGAILQKK